MFSMLLAIKYRLYLFDNMSFNVTNDQNNVIDLILMVELIDLKVLK